MYIDGINCNLCMSYVHDSMSGTSLDEEVYRIGQYCMEDQTADQKKGRSGRSGITTF